MKVHTTNYFNTFIEISDDSPTSAGEMPVVKGDAQTVATIQFEKIKANPYKYTSDDVLFHTFAVKKDLTDAEMEAERTLFFSKGQPCFRASPLTKRYGWGVHNNAEGKIAIFAADSEAYQRLAADKNLAHVKGMRSKKA